MTNPQILDELAARGLDEAGTREENVQLLIDNDRSAADVAAPILNECPQNLSSLYPSLKSKFLSKKINRSLDKGVWS
ncbi:Hypothetical predicted protein [Mytilus galloprovincialis]|uniref:SAP domain-containing protein n=1 Tax=Mytilus galloprovincialis TaxID=29158 RepID=A0A8B6F6Y6_MYTGA|nr:Hypothetical predicted protein [Mytilus galloprovincialis]